MFEEREREREQNEVYFQDHLNEEQLLDEIQYNKRSFLGNTFDNSPLYNEVVTKLWMLNIKLRNPIYNKTDNAEEKVLKLEYSIAEVQYWYLELLESCKRYLDTHSGIKWTSSGRARRNLIREIYDQAQYEVDYLNKQKKYEIKKTYASFSEMTFKDILKGLRTEVIDITGREDIENFGGAMSSGVAIGDGEDKKFFKPEELALEKFRSTSDLCPQLIDKFAISSKEKEVFEKILYSNKDFLEVCINDAFYDNARGCVCDFTQENFQKFLKELNIEFFIKENTIFIDGFKFAPESLNRFFNIIEEMLRLYDFSNTTNRVAKIQPGAHIETRNVATSRLFEALGEQDLVTKSRLAILREKGVPDKRGIIMNKAAGKSLQVLLKDLKDIKRQNIQIKLSKDVQRKFANLQFVDWIAGQIDRNLGNYFIDYEIIYMQAEGMVEVHITSIQGIDNDLSFGLLTGKEVLRGIEKLPLFNKNGLSLPFIDRNFADRLQSFNEITIEYIFTDLLNPEEMDALKDRVKEISQAIAVNYEDNQKLDMNGWNQNSLDATLTKKDNYLSRFINLIKDNLAEKVLPIVSD